MRDGVVLFLFSVAVLAGVVWVILNGGNFHLFGTSEPVHVQADSAPKAPETPPKPVKPVPKHKPVEAEVPPEPAPVVAVQPAAVIPGPEKPFPSADQINLGAAKSQLRQLCGPPQLYATGLDRGHVIETFMYAQPRSEGLAVIHLVDGKVASVNIR